MIHSVKFTSFGDLPGECGECYEQNKSNSRNNYHRVRRSVRDGMVVSLYGYSKMNKEQQKQLALDIIEAIDKEEYFVITTSEMVIAIGCGTIVDGVGMVSSIIAARYLCQQIISDGEN